MKYLRIAALVALLAGAAGSLGFWIHAVHRPPVVIIALFVVWVLSPFMMLGLGHMTAKRWRPGTQRALYWVTIFIALGTLVIYADDAISRRALRPALVYVVVPPMSWLLIGAAVTVGALCARKHS